MVSAVYHGPRGSVNIKITNGKYPAEGRKINVFTNDEVAMNLGNVIYFLSGAKYIRRNAMYNRPERWESNLVVDQWITGQNRDWTNAVGDAIVTELACRRTMAVITRYDVREATIDNSAGFYMNIWLVRSQTKTT